MIHRRVSPRHLGQMQSDGFCPRCFWYLVRMNFRMPFDRPMPGIMYHLDIFEKGLVDAYYAIHQKLPKWLDSLGCATTVEFPRKMTQEFPDLNITMVGMLDAVFARPNGKLVAVDYKSAHYKGDDDPYLPIYKIQLLGYSHLLESNGIGSVESAALVYFQNNLNDYKEKPLELLAKDGMTVPFDVKIHKVDIDMADLKPLLIKFRDFADAANPPEGLEKCKDCGRLELLLDFEVKMRDGQDSLRRTDQLFRQVYLPRLLADRDRAKRAGKDMEEDEFLNMSDEQYDARPAGWGL
jgi:hypothetical protein